MCRYLEGSRYFSIVATVAAVLIWTCLACEGHACSWQCLHLAPPEAIATFPATHGSLLYVTPHAVPNVRGTQYRCL